MGVFCFWGVWMIWTVKDEVRGVRRPPIVYTLYACMHAHLGARLDHHGQAHQLCRLLLRLLQSLQELGHAGPPEPPVGDGEEEAGHTLYLFDMAAGAKPCIIIRRASTAVTACDIIISRPPYTYVGHDPTHDTHPEHPTTTPRTWKAILSASSALPASSLVTRCRLWTARTVCRDSGGGHGPLVATAVCCVDQGHQSVSAPDRIVMLCAVRFDPTPRPPQSIHPRRHTPSLHTSEGAAASSSSCSFARSCSKRSGQRRGQSARTTLVRTCARFLASWFVL